MFRGKGNMVFGRTFFNFQLFGWTDPAFSRNWLMRMAQQQRRRRRRQLLYSSPSTSLATQHIYMRFTFIQLNRKTTATAPTQSQVNIWHPIKMRKNMVYRKYFCRLKCIGNLLDVLLLVVVLLYVGKPVGKPMRWCAEDMKEPYLIRPNWVTHFIFNAIHFFFIFFQV